ncbi:hypothetical protein [Thioalkalivibrio thiocyanodenitrificans]|uniref:hypothetical protein n=1 Tax=Thioalkalivibrio thiocyanodenitrificans TaxID=243063 RepID=UPI000374EB39|nr:hypothetical protein [Thioalkalivibrio thiocyanodenitrificans]
MPRNAHVLDQATRIVLLLGGMALAACGGGGGGGSSAADPAPTNAAEAVNYQFDQVTELMDVLTSMRVGANDALLALDEGRYADWDDYWENRYPALITRLGTASDNFLLSEEYVQALATGRPFPAASVNPQLGFLGWLGWAATVAATGKWIYDDRQARLEGRPPPPSEFEVEMERRRQNFIAHRRNQLETSGRSPSSAHNQAIAESLEVSALEGAEWGIEEARRFAISEGLTPGLSQYLPDWLTTLIDLGDIGENVRSIFSSRECGESVGPQSRPVWTVERSNAMKAQVKVGSLSTPPDGCRLYLCSTDNGFCPNLPVGDWDAVLFQPCRLRDGVADVTAHVHAPVTLDVNPIPIAGCNSDSPPAVGEPPPDPDTPAIPEPSPAPDPDAFFAIDSFSLPGYPASLDPDYATVCWASGTPGILTIGAFENFTGGADDKNVSIFLDTDRITGSGNYTLGQLFTDPGGQGMLVYSSPEIRNVPIDHPANLGDTPVGFSSSGGLLTLTAYGTGSGDRVTGTFSTPITGFRISGMETIGGFDVPIFDSISGNIAGHFDLVVQPDCANQLN